MNQERSQPLSLAPGLRLGPYEVLAPLGAGGMGEVYLAKDAKLGRDVAIKILPGEVVADPERLARFEREARLLASLNHPNIAAIYGLEEAEGKPFLVLELVVGEELAERLKRGPIAVDEALGIAKQIAEALEEAHEKGIVHRDLKPANIKITPDGKLKVLDFGLAKAYSGDTAAQPGADVSHSPTLAHTGTRAGVILGTAAYMSPEQARGKPVDKRADIWAFGVVLYEILTGRRLFEGETASDVLAGVLKTEIDLGKLPEATPPAIRGLLRRCLERNPRNRVHDIADARLALEDALGGRADDASASGAAASTRLSRRRAVWPWLAGIAVGAVALAIFDRTLRAPGPPASGLAETLRLAVLPPRGTLSSGPFDLAPDGRSIVFAASGSDGSSALYVRSLDAIEARKLPGTEGATLPFFSPDGRSVGFFADTKLQRIDLAGGPPRELAAVSDPRGASWGSEGLIVFAPDGGGALFSIPASGGEAVAVTRLDPAKDETSHRWPQFLPDGKRFVFLSRKPSKPRLALEVGSLDGTERVRLAGADSGARYAAGQLFFQRQTTLFAQRFEAARGALLDEAQPVAEDAWLNPDTDGLAAFAVAADGRFAYRQGGLVTGRLTWLGRDGKTLRTIGEFGILSDPTLSPDERRILVSSQGSGFGSAGLLLVDDANSIATTLTPRERDVNVAIFSPDGSRVLFSDDRNGPFDLYELKLSEPGKDVPVLATPLWKHPDSWSPDGRFVIYTEIDPASRGNLWILPRTGDAKPFLFLATAAAESGARFSPDGRFLAYASDESGREEVFVQPFPATGAKWQVSAAGGFEAAWRGDGRELFYVAPDARLTAVPVAPSPSGLTFGVPRALFRISLRHALGVANRSYAVSRDGQRFLVLEWPGEVVASPMVVVLGPAARGASKP